MSVSEDALEDRFRQRVAMGKSSLETVPISSVAEASRGNIPNTPLASSFVAFLLGITFAVGATLVATGSRPKLHVLTNQLGFFVASWALFHWLEFAVTAGWNREKCSVDSYLLDNGAMYHIANGVAVLEYVLTSLWKPSLKAFPYVTEIGALLVVLGQILRSLAMIHAATNFSHSVAFQKRANHRLVTDGVYSCFRHPSYAGFWYWAIGTQLVLQNPISFVFFAIVLWRFFYYRTRAEEIALVRFFGDEYVQYRTRVRVWIPFIP